MLHSGALRRRARRRLAAAAAGRAAGRGRRALGDLRAGPGPRPHRGRRGARGQLQERRDAALPRARRGRGSGAARGRAPRSGQRDAVARDAWRGRQSPRSRLLRLPERIGAGRCRRSSWWTCASRRRCAGPAASVPGRKRSTRPSWPRSRAGSRRCCCSTGAASRRSCSVPDCGEVWQCPACSISLTVHRVAAGTPLPLLRPRGAAAVRLRASAATPVQRTRGVGTQQLERLLAERFPEARLARMDLDTTSTKWSHQRILAAVEAGEVDMLLGTQMIAKGLDFPNVTLVGRGGRRHRRCTCPTSAPRSAPFSCWRRWRGGRGGGPRAGGCWCRPGIRSTTRSCSRRSTTRRGSSREERALRESPPYPPTTALVNLRGDRGLPKPRWGTRRGAGRLVRGAGRKVRTCRVTAARAGALSARADQGPVALARAAQGAIGGARPDRPLRGDAADAGGRRAGRHRSRSGVVALTTPAHPRTHRPGRARYPISAPK